MTDHHPHRERTPRSVLADELTYLGIGDGWDLAGILLDALTDDDVRYLARARMIELAEDA